MAEEPRGPVVREREPGAEEGQPTVVEREPALREREVVTEERRYPPPAPPAPTRTSALAIASLATGIAAWFIFPFLGAIAAVITGYFGLQEIRESGGRIGGSALATAGIVLGGVQLGLILIFGILIAIAASAAPGFGARLFGILLGY